MRPANKLVPLKTIAKPFMALALVSMVTHGSIHLHPVITAVSPRVWLEIIRIQIVSQVAAVGANTFRQMPVISMSPMTYPSGVFPFNSVGKSTGIIG